MYSAKEDMGTQGPRGSKIPLKKIRPQYDSVWCIMKLPVLVF